MKKTDSRTQANNKGPLIEERRQYDHATLRRDDLKQNPLEQFTLWLSDAREAKLIDATAVAVTTVGADQRPHTRMVLLKQFDQSGFVWFTDQSSAKAQQISQNPSVCMLFFWRELERQVRIEGKAVKLTAAEGDEYFYSRPQGSRFSAAASRQSTIVAQRQDLVDEVARLHRQHPDGNVPRPDHWGGYRLQPDYFEFWQGRDDRLHDRFIYSQADQTGANVQPDTQNQAWSIDRISP